jgi:predicted DNA-binding mobile mystery protein A
MPKGIHILLADILDTKLKRLQKSATELRENTPRGGWVRAIRTALGMSERAFARRLQLSYGAVQEIERNERRGKVTLETLRRAAETLDADLVYAIVPRRPIRETIAARAREIATERIAPISHSMAMEDQAVSAAQTARQIDELAKQLEDKARELWR